LFYQGRVVAKNNYALSLVKRGRNSFTQSVGAKPLVRGKNCILFQSAIFAFTGCGFLFAFEASTRKN
jgi:hypothetical protein